MPSSGIWHESSFASSGRRALPAPIGRCGGRRAGVRGQRAGIRRAGRRGHAFDHAVPAQRLDAGRTLRAGLDRDRGRLSSTTTAARARVATACRPPSSSPSRPTGASASAAKAGCASATAAQAKAASATRAWSSSAASPSTSSRPSGSKAASPCRPRGTASAQAAASPTTRVNAIYSADFAQAWHTDLNLVTTRLGQVDPRGRAKPAAVGRGPVARARRAMGRRRRALGHARSAASPAPASSCSPRATTSRSA